MNRAVRLTLAAALVLAAAVIGFLAYGWFADRAPAPVTTVATIDPAPAESEAATARELPAMRPVFSLKDREGRLRSITEWDGKSLVLNFWATWCAPCRREIPMLREINKARAGENIVVIGIAVDFREQVIAYANNIGLDYDLLIGEQDGLDALALFGVDAVGFPFTVFTDNQGRIVTAHVGELHADEAKVILDSVADINRGKVSFEAARGQIRSGLEALERDDKSG